MKRSSMIKLIQEHINKNVSYYYKNGVTFQEHEADDLLRRIEIWGMVPPLDLTRFFYSGGEHRWEPEETKEESIFRTINELKDNLGISEKFVCSLLGVTNIHDVEYWKIIGLNTVVNYLRINKSLTPERVIKALVTPKYKIEDGTYLDVVTAIQNGIPSTDYLIDIVNEALPKDPESD